MYPTLLQSLQTPSTHSHPIFSPTSQLTSTLFHITGSKGKTTTANYIHQLLPPSTSLFTSPHCFTLKERIRTNKLMKDEEFAALFDRKSTFFGSLTGAWIKFMEQNPSNFAVCEVGIGGLLDTTHVRGLSKRKIGVLTSAECEHQDMLGKSIQDVLFHKLAIFDTAEKIIVPRDLNLGSMDRFYGISERIIRVDCGEDYVEGNVRMAKRAVFEAGVRVGEVKTEFPGRNKQIGNFYIDSAHTVESVKLGLKGVKKGGKLIFSQTRKTRNWRAILKEIVGILQPEEIFYLPTSSSMDYRFGMEKSSESEKIGVEICNEIGIQMIQKEEVKRMQGDVVVMGSTHLACMVQWLLEGEKCLDFFK